MRRHRVRTPTVLQMEATECGAASLGIVLGYYHRFVPLAELRVVCGVSRDGINAANVVKAARHYGLDAKGYRLEVDTALAGPFPAIVFWNFNHFLVVEGVSSNRVYLNDPALGPRTISRQEFADSFTGILLRMMPSPGFKPGGEPPRVIPRLVGRLAGTGRPLGLLVVLSGLLVVPGLLIPGLTMVFVDQVLIEHAPGWLAPLLLGLCATMLLQGALAWLQKVLLLRLELWLALSQSASFLWRVLRLPIEFFTQRYNGDLVSRIESNDRVAKLLAADMGGAVLDLLTAVFMLIVMFLYDGVLASLAMVLSGLNVVVLRLAQRRRADMAIRLQSDQAKLFATSVIGLRTIETLKASGTEPDFFAKWAGYHARTLNSEQRLAIVTQLTSLAPALTAGLLMTAILGFGAIRVMHGDLTLGALIAFQMLVGNFTGPVQRMVEVAGTGQQAMADLARLDDVNHHALDWRHARETVAAEDRPVRGEIALKNVMFGYSPLDPPLIDDFSLDVAPGVWVALVGASGSGKSTIVRLVAGLHRPWSGSVALDGRPLETWDGAALAGALATVDQDIQIFSGTMRENITLWDDTIPDAQVRAATVDAALLEVVERLPGNFGGRIDEDGRNLSGGQRQRVEIARALARDPAVLILDEATAALDPVTEKKVADAVRRRGCTCIIAAHRLSTIRDCDEIIVLDHGKVVERGRHAELMAMRGAYALLVEDES